MIAIYCRKCVGPLALGLVCWSESRKALSRAIPCASSRFGRPPPERYSSENGKEQALGHRTRRRVGGNFFESVPRARMPI
jgi:hypothetical protein